MDPRFFRKYLEIINNKDEEVEETVATPATATAAPVVAKPTTAPRTVTTDTGRLSKGATIGVATSTTRG